jgi:hypothetical protein
MIFCHHWFAADASQADGASGGGIAPGVPRLSADKLLHNAVFQRVEADHRQAPAGPQQRYCLWQSRF